MGVPDATAIDISQNSFIYSLRLHYSLPLLFIVFLIDVKSRLLLFMRQVEAIINDILARLKIPIRKS